MFLCFTLSLIPTEFIVEKKSCSSDTVLLSAGSARRTCLFLSVGTFGLQVASLGRKRKESTFQLYFDRKHRARDTKQRDWQHRRVQSSSAESMRLYAHEVVTSTSASLLASEIAVNCHLIPSADGLCRSDTRKRERVIRNSRARERDKRVTNRNRKGLLPCRSTDIKGSRDTWGGEKRTGSRKTDVDDGG